MAILVDDDRTEIKGKGRMVAPSTDFDYLDEAGPDASRAFKMVQLRLKLKEREATAMRLIELDFAIWALEEYFRGRDGP